MSACWPLQMPATAKAVLISLADQANDEGVCWPSVGTMSKRTCLSERAVRYAIRWLEVNGYVHAEMKSGRSTRYTITPAPRAPLHDVPPAPRAPAPAPDAPAPAPRAPRTVKNRQQNRQKAAGRLELPEWLSPEVWHDWDAYRRARKGWTQKAQELSLQTLSELREQGNDPRKVVDRSIERGWTGLFPSADTRKGSANDALLRDI